MKDMWQLQDAKSRFSELVDRTISDGPQVVTRRGRKAVVVVPYEEYQRLTQKPMRLSEFLRSSPLAGTDIDFSRDQDLPRDIDFEL
jgi:prevent-host-death family protein